MDKETSEREALLPCPWCGGTRICPDQFLAPHEIEANGGKYAWTMCCEEPACGYMTATYRTLEEARAAWNRRAQPASVPEDVRDAEHGVQFVIEQAGEPKEGV